jgi:hypothetical protein
MKTKNKSKSEKSKGIIGITLAAIMIASIFAIVAPTAVADPDPATTINTVRIYGEDGSGAGAWVPGEDVCGRIYDPVTGMPVEQQPYTSEMDSVEDIFDPQGSQAPRKDSITFNPAYLSEYCDPSSGIYDDCSELGGSGGLASDIKTDGANTNEKVFFRQWYQPDYLDKDTDVSGWVSYRIIDGGDGIIETAKRIGSDDVQVTAVSPGMYRPNAVIITAGPDGVLESIPGDIDGDGAIECTDTDDYVQEVPSAMPDEHYPAIVQEFTYMFVEGKELSDKPEPTAGAPGTGTAMVFPVGIRESLFDDATMGYGLTSLDPTLDGVNNPTVVEVHSEITLAGLTNIGADFNGNGALDTIDRDDTRLTGDELVILSPSTILNRTQGSKTQFLDHMVEVKEVFTNPASVKIGIWYTGDIKPRFVGDQIIAPGDMILIGTKMPATYIPAGGNNLGILPRGAFFIYIASINAGKNAANIKLGRALGATHSAMEQAATAPDTRKPDPWWLKRFYVDGHEYNTVAIYSDGNVTGVAPEFKFITIRTPIPKEGQDLDPVVLIEQHSVRLQPYEENRPLSVMAPYNYQHTELMDIQKTHTDIACWRDTAWKNWIGDPLLTKPIYHTTGPYTKIGEEEPSIDLTTEDLMFYVEELTEPELTGELKEKYTGIIGDVILDLDGNETLGIGSTTTDMEKPDDNLICANVTELKYVNTSEGETGFDIGIDWIIFDWNGDGYYNESEGVLEGSGTAAIGDPLADFDDCCPPGMVKFNDTDGNQEYNSGEDVILDINCNGSYDTEEEWWYVEQYNTAPDEYTEFYLPVGHGLNLIVPNYHAPEKISEHKMQIYHDTCTYDSTTEYGGRVKFWYNASVGGKKYKNDTGVRLYGATGGETIDTWINYPVSAEKIERAGDRAARDPLTGHVPEDLPYTVDEDIFNPQFPQAYPKDILTVDPAWMDEYYNGEESLVSLYSQLSIEGNDAREKVFMRLWYEPEHLDKDVNYDNKLDPDDDVTYPAVMQEFTYMFVGVDNQPAHGQPGVSTFGFPMGTRGAELDDPFGYGVTTFDLTPYNGVDNYNAVTVHSEQSLAKYTGVQCDFDGDGALDLLDTDGIPLNGSELVIFSAMENMGVGDKAQFLDFMIEVVSLSTTPASADFNVWKLGDMNCQPKNIGSISTLGPGAMTTVYLDRINNKIPAGGSNLGLPMTHKGPWFVYVNAVNPGSDRVAVTIGRALGGTHTAMEQADSTMDLTPGDPWYIKRFYVDGHEYNVVAVRTVPADVIGPGDEPFEFKYITIRTPVQKETTIISQHSFKCQGYGIGAKISVMPPFNYEHTVRADIQDGWLPPKILASPMGFIGPIEKHKEPFNITIVEETREKQFYGELKELYNEYDHSQVWNTTWFHTIPSSYTEFHITPVEKYLVTSNWAAPQGVYQFVNFDRTPNANETDAGVPNVTLAADASSRFLPRVKFWYDPLDTTDLYVNTKTIDKAEVSGFVNDVAGKYDGLYGATVTISNATWSKSTTVDIAGNYVLAGIDPGEYTMNASQPGYITETVPISLLWDVVVDFTYDNGLIPEQPNMDYVLKSIRLWYEGKISMETVLEVISAWSS